MTVDTQYAALVSELKQTTLLGSCASLLGWDEQTNLPPRGAEHRAEQLALLAGMVHERTTAPVIGEYLEALRDAPLGPEDAPQRAVVREARRSYERATKLPRRLVEELSRTTTLAQQAWVQARKGSSFAQFQPWLEKIVALKREEADAVGYGAGIRYDALLDEFASGWSRWWLRSAIPVGSRTCRC
jgi:carboxypeptidase Taq